MTSCQSAPLPLVRGDLEGATKTDGGGVPDDDTCDRDDTIGHTGSHGTCDDVDDACDLTRCDDTDTYEDGSCVRVDICTGEDTYTVTVQIDAYEKPDSHTTRPVRR